MLNMLNQFYKYMGKKLIDFLQKENMNGGERFNLQFDEEQNVTDFYHILQSMPEAEPFTYQHENATPYQTFCLKINDIKVVVAATIDDITTDFLVLIRNQVSDQEDMWKNTALISISHLSLDSIQGGSKDLQQKGMPFNIKKITEDIKKDLDSKKELAKSEKEIIKYHLDKRLEDIVVQTSIWDYAEVIALIDKGEIQTEDYKSLNLFPDQELGKDSHLTINEIRSRLENNNRLFELVQRIHDYETLDTELEKNFDEKLIPKLKNDNWHEINFPTVRNAYDNVKKTLIYNSTETKKLNKDITFWERAQLTTKVGQRKRHIIIFNESMKPTIEMSFEFDDFLKKQFIDKKSAHLAVTSGKKLNVSLTAGQQIRFHQIKYKHNHENQSAYTFNFCVVPFAASELAGIESMFEVIVKTSESGVLLKYQGENMTFGAEGPEKVITLTESFQTVMKASDEKLLLEIEAGAWDDDSLKFTLQIKDQFLQFECKDSDSKSIPIAANRVWKLKREKQEHFYLENDRLKHGTETFYPHEEFKEKLLLEKEWIDNGYTHLLYEKQDENYSLPSEVQKAYHDYLSYFKSRQTLPSLAYMDETLKELAQKYIQAVIAAIKEIEEHSLLTAEQKNIFKLGMSVAKGKLWLTPLHPLNVAYQLQLTNELQDEHIDNVISERLQPHNLLPFLYSLDNDLYRPSMNTKYAEWIEYEDEKIISVGSANEYLETVVEEKIQQFLHHFDYLFLESAQSPLLLNVIQINNDKEVVKGIYTFLKKQLETKGPERLLPIEIAIYREDIQQASAFELFSTLQTPSEVESEFEISLKTKDFDEVDVLRLIREHIHYYKINLTSTTEFQYAHISFFKLPTQDIDASHQVDKMETGIALNGILSSVVSIASESDYRSGYGLLHAPDDKNELIQIATCYNELSFNMQNEGKNSYSKGKSIVMSTSTEGKVFLDKLYKSSAWVTFIDPGVDLDFFQKSSSNLLVIHYNDQHTSSDRYDAITVTENSEQYKSVISNYIEEKVKVSSGDVDLAIKSFNSINGEWLLSIIGSKGHFAREKISIISAMKFLESYLYHPNITWVPVSLEEILRVAGAIRLTKSDGIFSAKNLGSIGKHSDDILMMGIEQIDDQLFIHFYPVEVKIGGLQTNKAKIQIDQTKKLFRTHLIDAPGESSFKKKYYRNFFAQMLLSNAKKLHANGIWSNEKYTSIHNLKSKLMNDSFKIGLHLEPFIKEAAVLTFRKDHSFRTAQQQNDVLNITFIEEDAYAGLAMSNEEILEKMQRGYLDFDPDSMLISLYDPSKVNTEQNYATVIDYTSNEASSLAPHVAEDHDAYSYEEASEKEAEEKDSNPVESNGKPEEEKTNVHSNTVEASEDAAKSEVKSNIPKKEETTDEFLPLDQIRIPFGKLNGSTQSIYWEYGNKGLANRHLSITGRSGQGKTYFIQCILWELAKNGISSIIIDYTDGYKKSQLEDHFKDKLGSNLEQFIVLQKKFPVNPFKRNMKELDEDITVLEDDSDVAERMKNVIGSIYPTLGIQQLNSVYQAVMKGMSLYDNKMNLSLLRDLLEEDGSGPAKTALSQMNLLIDKNPFDYEQDFDWSFLEKEKGKVFVIQLTGYSEDVQKMITEFILWDLWYYKLQHGKKNLPFPVILDESQRLDFSNGSPSAKILVEGRKFGWSGWFSTQFLKGFASDQVSRLQNAAVKIYFSPMENEISTIASTLAQDNAERKDWETKLNNLKKGQCIVHAPILDRNGNLLPAKPYLVDIAPFDER